jgi:dolichyl-phosphate-mannose-protein mannosyltransferase
VVTIVLLSIVFFSIAASNLGLTQTPTTTVLLTGGQSFYIDLGSSANVKLIVVLLKQGAMNFTISTGLPGNWQNDSIVNAWPYSSNSFGEDYYKWHEIDFQQTAQYLEFNVTQAGGYNTNIAEIAVIGQNNQTIPVQSITNLAGDNPNLQNLIDEQGMVQYPSDYMSNTYFDEIYFVRTAEQYLHLQMPYEWTHPPLGKLIQASGIAVFGFSPFGWRIMGVIFATLMIGLVYLLGKQLLGTWIGGFAAAFLLTFDFMHFTMSRLGTADTYVIFFNVAAQLFFLIYLKNVFKNGWNTSVLPLGLAFVFFALAFSSKWLVLYGFVGLMLILVAMRLNEVRKVKDGVSAKVYAFLERPYSAIVGFILVALLIYFLTYIPDMLAGRSVLDVISLQGSMYIYHSTLTATHPFSSPWYSWPFMVDFANGNVHVPIWLQSAGMQTDIKSTIVGMGNPAVWWVGFGAIIAITVSFLLPWVQGLAKFLRSKIKHTTEQISIKTHLPELFLVVVFFFQWLPYILISRVVFIYHFYTCVPIMCLAAAFFISKYWSNRWVKILTVAYFALVVAMFVLFYPVISGVPAANSTIDSLKWIKSWVF